MSRPTLKPVVTHRGRGFTLLELLVAILIFALLMTLSISSVRIAGQSLVAGVTGADATEEMRTVSDFLRRQMASLPPLVTGEGRDRRIALKADSKSLSFVAPAPQYSYGPGLIVYELTAERIDGLEYLTLSYAPYDPGTPEWQEQPPGARRIISRGFEGVTFDYFGSEMKRDPPAWKSDWRDDAELFPSAVRIRTRPSDMADGWPDLVYVLRTAGRS
mgnify:CR=1 FL=1